MILLLKNEAGKKSVLPFLKNVFFIEAKEIGGERDHSHSGKQTDLYLHRKKANNNGQVIEDKVTRTKYGADDNMSQKLRSQPTADPPLNPNRYIINKSMMKKDSCFMIECDSPVRMHLLIIKKPFWNESLIVLIHALNSRSQQ